MVGRTSAASASPERGRFLELDGLRGVATLLIVWTHIDQRPLFWAWSLMDMFFVLSSFLLTRIVFKKCTDFSGVVAFYGRRIERIWPLYFLTVSVLFAVTFAINQHRGIEALDLTVFARLYTFSQYSEMMFHPVAGHEYIYYARHLWSLAIEEQFYVLLPLAILLLRRTPTAVALAVLLAVVGASIYQRAVNPNMYVLTSHADAFALGSLMAVSFNRISEHALLASRILLGIAAISLILFLPYILTGYSSVLTGGVMPEYEAGAATASTMFWAAAIGLLALHRGVSRLSFMRCSAFVHMGRLSYALYLVHFPILRLLAKPLAAEFPGLTLLTAQLLCLPLIWLLAELLYRTIDRPLQERRPSNLRSDQEAKIPAATG